MLGFTRFSKTEIPRPKLKHPDKRFTGVSGDYFCLLTISTSLTPQMASRGQVVFWSDENRYVTVSETCFAFTIRVHGFEIPNNFFCFLNIIDRPCLELQPSVHSDSLRATGLNNPFRSFRIRWVTVTSSPIISFSPIFLVRINMTPPPWVAG